MGRKVGTAVERRETGAAGRQQDARMQPQVKPRLRVLSVQLPLVGNKIYGEMIRRAFDGSAALELFPYWTHEERELHSRLLNRLLYTRFPVPWVKQRNLDLSRARREFGYGYYGRRLVERHVRVDRPDVLHFHTQTPALLCADYIRRIPTVITTDQTGLQGGMELPPAWQWTYFGNVLLERAPLRAAAAVVVFSQWAADSMVASHGIAREKLHVIPPGIERAFFSDVPARREGGTQRLLFVGADFKRKGGELLVDVFVERFARRDVELHVVTTEPNVRKHPKVIVHYGVSAYTARWKQLYADADVFVLPTRWDSFGLAYLEAMSAGLPVIGSAINAGPEIIVDGETGYALAPGDGHVLANRIERLLDSGDLRRSFGERGRARVLERFDSQRNAARLETVFLSIAPRASSV